MAYEIRVHRHGQPHEAIMVCHAPRKAALATARRLGAEVFPGCTITKSGASALLVTREGE